jgi:glycerol uptake facilitator-like aquaporin
MESHQKKPRLVALLCVGEFVGTFIANFLTLVVIQASSKLSTDAATKSLMGQLNPLVQVPPELAAYIPGHPALAPQATLGNLTGMLGGNIVQPASSIAFPDAGLLVAVGIALSYAIALSVATHRQLNPTFTVAMALFGALKWKHAIPCIVAQMLGGLFACSVVWSCASTTHLCFPDAVTGAMVCGHIPKTLETAGLYGVSYPPTDPFTWRPGGESSIGNEEFEIGWLFWNNTVYTALMVIAIIPLFAGTKKIPEVATPFVIAAVIIPFVMGTTAFGVQNNAALFIGGLIFCSIAGWPSTLWSHASCYWVVAATSPFLGAAVGVGFLKFFGWLVSEEGPLYEKVAPGSSQLWIEGKPDPSQLMIETEPNPDSQGLP